MKIALYAGSFDPITNGHLDILKKGLKIFDKVIIAVANNVNKKGFLPVEKRVELLKECVNGLGNVEVDVYDGLTAEYAKKVGATILLRGLRNSCDFEYENQIAQTNSALNNDITTVFITANSENNFISSSMVREVYLNNGDVSKFVPNQVCEYLKSL